MAADYTASQFTVLKGLEPVKLRPGMYTRTTCPTHIVQEAIDNAADEALAGHATKISVILDKEGCVTVEDNGRGIPVGIPHGESRPAAELAFTTLHAGGKFDKTDSQSAYRFSGGLHGVGVAVTNALSKRVEVEIKTRDPEGSGNGHYRIIFAGGDVTEPLTRLQDCGPRTHGTVIRIWPDGQYFDSPKIHVRELTHLLRSKAILLPGLQVTLSLPEQEPVVWQYAEGLRDYLQEIIADAEPVTPIFSGMSYQDGDQNGFAKGEGAAWALAWCASSPAPETYVNLIPTLNGGTHESGFRAGVFEAVRTFMEHHSLTPAKLKLVQEDVTGKMALVLSARMLDPQFQGQTKDKLTSRDAHKLLSLSIKDPLELWLNSHPDAGKAIADLAIQSAQARTRAAQKIERKKGSGLATLPGKLTDCESEDITRNEIFLVEGDSAGGSAKMARDKEFQAILPLRGKVLNTWEVDRDVIFKNQEVHNMAVALGIEAHSANADPETALTGLRYGKIIILSDADVDGSHIQVLLLTMFLRHFPALMMRGHVMVAKPPLYRVDATVRGKPRKLYCEAEAERDTTIERLLAEGVKEAAITVQRFKGLGEMNPDQLWETAMCPETRTLMPLAIQPGEIAALDTQFTLLMGKNEAGGRRAWMERDGWTADLDI
ncbi:DNA topoisomerase IV subunit B [Acidithiobacillus ferrooxidans]|uniref:DNA topoisomerase IV subunit B n=1 Tax=Acidithiobacillus ferrooxidans TaxID=920 RepID=UPI000A414527|nr:DNA topoisomerase IV subunit B [Acidithiobacillus ferrooxidans]